MMKKIIYLFMGMSLLLATACSKDDDGGSGGNAGAGTITAKIDGSSFTSLEMATTASRVEAGGGTTITIQGSDADGRGIVFVLSSGYEGVGTYEIGPNNIFVTAQYVEANVSNPMDSQTWQAPYEGSDVVGELKVSEDDGSTIKGTFNFEAKNSNDDSMKNITNGSFNMEIQEF